jgi:hypothetical protein
MQVSVLIISLNKFSRLSYRDILIAGDENRFLLMKRKMQFLITLTDRSDTQYS